MDRPSAAIAPYIKAHDAFFRHVFGHPECQAGLVRYAWSQLRLEAAVPTSGTKITVLDASFTGGKSADLVLQVEIAHSLPIVLLFEHKSSRDRRTALQLMGYSVALANRLSSQDPLVIPIIFYHGTHPWKHVATPRIVGFTFAPLIQDLRHFGRRGLAEVEAEIGARTTAALLVMARVRFELTEHDVREVLAYLTTAQIDDQFRRDLLWYFAYNTPVVNRDLILKLAAEPQYNSIGGEAMTMGQAYRLEGRLEGKEEGVQQTRREIALNALSQGFEVDTIARLTGLDVASIERLAAEEAIEEGGNGSH